MPFVLDRMVAILGALLEDNDVESRLADRQLTIPGEHTDMEIARVGIFSSVSIACHFLGIQIFIICRLWN